MKILTKASMLFAFLFLFSTVVSAQDYKAAVGLRLGSPTSASIKYFLDDSNAIEGYVGFRGYSWGGRWTSINGAYLRHQELSDLVEGLTWYGGGGASVLFWNYDNFREFSSTSIGLQAYVGVDYAFKDLPISITVDWVPSFFIGSAYFTGFGADYGSLGIRYIFKR